MTAKTIALRDVPQKDDLAAIRAVVSAIGDGATSTHDVAAATKLQPRQVAYAVAAARTLGWISDEPSPRLTSRGVALLEHELSSPGGREAIRTAVENSETVRAIAPNLLVSNKPAPATWARRIVTLTGSSSSVAQRRAGTLLAWRRQILDPQITIQPSSSKRHPTFAPAAARLSSSLVHNLARTNPWWQGGAPKQLPPVRRDFVATIHRRLKMKLAPIVVVRGPRQVGKTTAQLQVIDDLLKAGVEPTQILRVQCDELPDLVKLTEPILRIVDWYEATVLGRTLNDAAHEGRPTYLFFDEVQNLSDWAIQLKYLVDSSTTQVVVTGSSALRIEAGRDSLAGRINTIEVGTLTLHEISAIRFRTALDVAIPDNGLERLADAEFWRAIRDHGAAQAVPRDLAFAAFSERGGYPLVHERATVPWPEVAAQLNETVIRRVIQHDLRVGDRGRRRDPALLEELFRLACRYAGQSPSIETFAREAQRALHANVGIQKIRQYLTFLDRTLLLRLVRPLEIRLKRTQGAAKLCLADHGLRASWLQEIVPLLPRDLDANPHLSDLAGRLAESIVGTYLLTIGGLDLAHFPARPSEPEVDFVMTIGTRRIPIEVKYRRRIDPFADTEGLRSFIEKTAYNAPFGILITQTDAQSVPDPRIIALPLASLLLLR